MGTYNCTVFICILHNFFNVIHTFMYVFFFSPNNTILTVCDLFSGSCVLSVHYSGRPVDRFSQLIGTDNRLTKSS